jgi:hypothetical protein
LQGRLQILKQKSLAQEHPKEKPKTLSAIQGQTKFPIFCDWCEIIFFLVDKFIFDLTKCTISFFCNSLNMQKKLFCLYSLKNVFFPFCAFIQDIFYSDLFL